MNLFLNLTYILLFSVNSLCTVLVASLTGADWDTFTRTQQFVIIAAILGNWTNVLLALMQKLQAKIKKGKDLMDTNGGTEIITKADVQKP